MNTNKTNIPKVCSELFISSLDKQGYTCENINYLDGYYIFDFGKDTVLHFNLKETPGWLYGVWWNEPVKGSRMMRGEFFAQYEKDIDKFKPSRSTFVTDVSIVLTKDLKEIDKEFMDVECLVDTEFIKYIRKHRIRARNVSSWGSLYDCKPWIKCLSENVGEDIFKFKRERFNNYADRKLMKFLIKNVLTEHSNVFILKYRNMSPQYEIIAPFICNRKLYYKKGNYSLFDKDEYYDSIIESPDSSKEDKREMKRLKKLKTRFYKKKKRFDKIAKLIGLYYYSCGVSDCICITSASNYRRLKNEMYTNELLSSSWGVEEMYEINHTTDI